MEAIEASPVLRYSIRAASAAARIEALLTSATLSIGVGGDGIADEALIGELTVRLQDAHGRIRVARTTREPTLAAEQAARAALDAATAWEAFDAWQDHRLVPRATATAISIAEDVARHAAEAARAAVATARHAASLAADLAEMEVVHRYWKAGLTA